MRLLTATAVFPLLILLSGWASEGTASDSFLAESRLRRGTSETVSAATNFASEKGAQVQKSLEKQLGELNLDIEQLKTRIEKAKADARVRLIKELPRLEEKKAELEIKLMDLKSRSEKAWEDLSTGTVSAIDELRKSLKKARSRFD